MDERVKTYCMTDNIHKFKDYVQNLRGSINFDIIPITIKWNSWEIFNYVLDEKIMRPFDFVGHLQLTIDWNRFRMFEKLLYMYGCKDIDLLKKLLPSILMEDRLEFLVLIWEYFGYLEDHNSINLSDYFDFIISNDSYRCLEFLLGRVAFEISTDTLSNILLSNSVKCFDILFPYFEQMYTSEQARDALVSFATQLNLRKKLNRNKMIEKLVSSFNIDLSDFNIEVIVSVLRLLDKKKLCDFVMSYKVEEKKVENEKIRQL